MKNIITTMDLGSNSFRILKFDKNDFSTKGEFEKTVGTADGLAETGNISKEALQRVIIAINEGIEKLQFDPRKTIAVTTQAMRVAKNSKYILDEIEKETKVKFNIIDGQKEANFTLLAIQYALKRENISSEKFVLLDIGGGSTELILYKDGQKKIKSFSFGVVTLSQSKSFKDDINSLENEILEFLIKINLDNFSFVSTAGTPTTIAALKYGLDYNNYDKQKINGTKLYLSDLFKLQKELKTLPKEDLIKKVGKGRENYIDTGIEIYKLFYKVLNKEFSIVFDDGLREGVAINHALSYN